VTRSLLNRCPSRRAPLAVLAAASLAASVAVALPAYASATANEIVYALDSDEDGYASVVLRDLLRGTTSIVLAGDVDGQSFYDGPDLTPAGDRVVVATDRGAPPGNGDLGIATVTRGGTGFTRLTTPPAGRDDWNPKVSPDGSKVLFTRASHIGDNVVGTLYTVPIGGGPVTPVVGGGGNVRLVGWGPDGTKVVFEDYTAENATGPRLKVLTLAGAGVQDLAVNGLSPAWSPMGDQIAYTPLETDEISRISLVPSTGGAPKVLTRTRPAGATGASFAVGAAWLPDGESLVFTLWGPDDTADLWTVDRFDTRSARVVGGRGDQYTGTVHGPAPAPVSAGTPSRFSALPDPGRILDTRVGVGAVRAPVGPRGTVDVQVTGTLPTADGRTVEVPASATAVVMNVTAVRPTAETYLKVYPAGQPSDSSSLNAAAGANVPNLVTVKVGAGGKVTVYNNLGQTGVVADVAGYYGPDGEGFTPLAPHRLMDTRTSLAGHGTGKVSAARDLTVRGVLPVQGGGTVTVPEEATAVVLNVTATAVSATSADVRVYPTPTGEQKPLVSNLNMVRGQTVANLVTVTVGASGKVRFLPSAGDLHLVVDLAGYYLAGSGNAFVPVTPARFLDSRSGTGTMPAKLGGAQFADLKVAGSRGVPTNASAAVLNLTVTGVDAVSTHITAYPKPASGTAVPTASNLNTVGGDTRANLAIVQTGDDGRVRLRNNLGSLHLVGDLAGYFVPLP
jgi:Tol biopolymer transport system component